MNARLESALSQTAAETLEALTFMFIAPDDMGDEGQTIAHTAIVAFKGPASGRLEVGVSKPMLPALGMNMLGADDILSVSLEQQRDALRELANVICGNLLPALAGEDAVFDLAAPDLRSEEEAPPDGDATPPEAEVRLATDEGLLVLRLFVAEGSLEAEAS